MTTNNNNTPKYIIVSPVKDEESYIYNTIESVSSQSILPRMWIIVDDGSSDRTRDIIREYCNGKNWVKLISLNRDRTRIPGPAVVNAFNVGYGEIKHQTFEYIVKLDGDLKFDHDYFEKILCKFEENEMLGIASGVYHEKEGKEWIRIKMPSYHAAGACKVMRKKCFEDIGGFESSRGWDTLDEIKAMVHGWETCHFSDIHFYHLKKEGSGIGALRTNFMHGEIYYLTGGSKFFFIFKVIHRCLYGNPFLVASLYMLYGYVKPLLTRKKRLVNKEEMKLYRKILNRRIFNYVLSRKNNMPIAIEMGNKV